MSLPVIRFYAFYLISSFSKQAHVLLVTAAYTLLRRDVEQTTTNELSTA